MNWYKRHMADYARDTAGLKMIEHGAYSLLLDHYYTTESPLPANKEEVYRITRAIERWDREAVDSVLAKFYNLTDAGYTQKRVEEELAKYKKAADVYRSNALGCKAPTKAVGKAHSKADRRSKNLRIKDKDLKPKTIAQQNALGEFDVFWASYPRKIGKPAALRAWRAVRATCEIALPGLEKWKAVWTDKQYIPYPATWLNRRQWEDEPTATGGWNGNQEAIRADAYVGAGPELQTVYCATCGRTKSFHKRPIANILREEPTYQQHEFIAEVRGDAAESIAQ